MVVCKAGGGDYGGVFKSVTGEGLFTDLYLYLGLTLRLPSSSLSHGSQPSISVSYLYMRYAYLNIIHIVLLIYKVEFFQKLVCKLCASLSWLGSA